MLSLVIPPWSASGLAVPQNDAGSGMDAGDDLASAMPIATNVTYMGTFAPRGSGEGAHALDDEDHYSFHAVEGRSIRVTLHAPIACAQLFPPAATQPASGACAAGGVWTGSADVTASESGRWILRLAYNRSVQGVEFTLDEPYRFAVHLDGEAPLVPALEIIPPDGAVPAVSPARPDDEHVVIAVIDSGINPYHEFFRAVALDEHPSTWLPGFPSEATSMPLSVHATSYAEARAMDDALWRNVKRTTYDTDTDLFTTRLYTFPGTRVIGGVSFGEFSSTRSPAPPGARLILDDNGHGTHSAGLAAGANLSRADGNVLIVAVEASSGQFTEAIMWAARQPWIDAISASIGRTANAPTSTALVGGSDAHLAILEAERAGKPVFIASGNGISQTGVPPDHCSTYTSPYTGPAWSTRVGAAQRDTGAPTWWHCMPVDVTARTDVGSLDHASFDGVSGATGTSAATPNAAGHFAMLLLEARRNDISAPSAVVLDHLLHNAVHVMAGPGELGSDPLPRAFTHYVQGYGLVTEASIASALDELRTGAGPAARQEVDAWMATDEELRRTLWDEPLADPQELRTA